MKPLNKIKLFSRSYRKIHGRFCGLTLLTCQIPWLRAAAATDVVTEIVIMGLPIIGFHSSLMSISRKTIVVMAFFTRVPYVYTQSPYRLLE
jgi:hypothetical protein